MESSKVQPISSFVNFERESEQAEAASERQYFTKSELEGKTK